MSTDREKLIKHFEHLLNAAKGNYQDFVDLTVDAGEEILAMLKEQQEKVHRVDTTKVKTVQRIAKSEDNGTYFTMIWYECEECGHKINGDDIFCAGCGKEVDRSKVVYWKKKPEEEKSNE